MKIKNRLLYCLLSCCLFVCSVSLTACFEDEAPTPSQGLKYTLTANGTAYSVTGIGTCQDADVIIPNAYNDLPVIKIGTAAFHDCTSLTSVVIPDTVTAIGEWAFAGCKNIESIVIPESVARIDDYAFAAC